MPTPAGELDRDPSGGRAGAPSTGLHLLRQHEKAARVRAEACRRLVSGGVPSGAAAELLIDLTLDPPMLRSNAAVREAFDMARRWALPVQPVGCRDRREDSLWTAGRSAKDLASAVVLAHREIDLRAQEREGAPNA